MAASTSTTIAAIKHDLAAAKITLDRLDQNNTQHGVTLDRLQQNNDQLGTEIDKLGAKMIDMQNQFVNFAKMISTLKELDADIKYYPKGELGWDLQGWLKETSEKLPAIREEQALKLRSRTIKPLTPNNQTEK